MNHQFVDHTINQKYKDYLQPLNQNVYQILESRLQKINKKLSDSRVLDFGCNNGHLLLTSNGQISSDNYIGLDINPLAIHAAQQKFPEYSFVHYNRYNNTFNPTGKIDLPIPDLDKFDIIVCYGVFTHFFMNDIQRTIEELKKKLRVDGVIIFSIWEDVDFYGYLGFLDRQLHINTGLVKPSAFNNGFVLVNRERLLVDVDQAECYNYDWIESFYRPEYILKSIPGSRKIDGLQSKHPVYIVTA